MTLLVMKLTIIKTVLSEVLHQITSLGCHLYTEQFKQLQMGV